jgi:hypothetical protein
MQRLRSIGMTGKEVATDVGAMFSVLGREMASRNSGKRNPERTLEQDDAADADLRQRIAHPQP